MFLGVWTPKKLQVSNRHSLFRWVSDRLTPQVQLRSSGRRCRSSEGSCSSHTEGSVALGSDVFPQQMHGEASPDTFSDTIFVFFTAVYRSDIHPLQEFLLLFLLPSRPFARPAA